MIFFVSMKILVALSWGVDSAVVAALLQKEWHEVHAGFMINYLTDDESCTTKRDLKVASEVAEYLHMPFYTFDFIREYEERIIELIYRGYARWETPNPDIWCNNLVKFDLFAEEAKNAGYDAIATGHYAQIKKEDGWNYLLRGVDPSKDQSYFLSRLSQSQLSYALMPLWIYPKVQVRELAQHFELPNAERKDSQWLCFIGKVSMQDFLSTRLPPKKWPIMTTSGTVIGEHEWLWRYTIWQRKGIEVGGGPALYVIKKDREQNALIVGTKSDPLRAQYTFRITDSNLLIPEAELNTFINTKPDSITGEIRYHQKPQKISHIQKINTEYIIQFASPQFGWAPWQSIMLCRDDICILSGVIVWIDEQ